MKFILLNKEQQFKELKKGDFIIVKWLKGYAEHTPNCKEIMSYNIYQNKSYHHEIICRIKGNHYFNYRMYLEGKSGALEVYKVEGC